MEEITEKKQKSVVVLVEGKYGIILLDDRNWVVARLKPLIKSDSCTPENFDNNSYTYHANLQQAVINLSNRLLKDTIRNSCKDKPLELTRLAEIIMEKDQWMRRVILGRETLLVDVVKEE